jgi:pilus assembly protein Flp/PilA
MLHLAMFIQERLAHEEDGVTAIEYGLLAALIAIVIIVAVTLLGTTLSGVFDTVSSSIAPVGP